MPANPTVALPELIRLLRESAGEEEGVNLDGDVLETPFVELGYDSLALLQVVARVQREYGVQLPDEAVVEAESPKDLLALINGSAAPAVG